MEQSISSLSCKCGIPEAIAESQRSRKLFVVYISGGNNESNRLESDTWPDDRVANFVSTYCILVHIRGGSPDATNFSAIYPQKSVPSITVVGYNGVQLWQNEGFINAEDLASNFEKARLSLLMQETTAAVLTGALYSSSSDAGSKEIKGTSVAFASSSSSATTSGNLGSDLEESKASGYQEDKKNIDSDACGVVDIKSSEVVKSVQDDLKCNSTGESEDDHPIESQSELRCIENIKERSYSGEISIMDAVESNARKGVDQLHCENQCEQFENGLESEELEAAQCKDVFDDKKNDLVNEKAVPKSTDIFLSIRLPSGITLLEKFEQGDELQMVKQYVENECGTIGNYNLAIPYPRKVFHDQDLDKSLAELNLLNRQALIVVPHHSGASPAESVYREHDSQSNNSGGYFVYVKRLLSFINPLSYLRTSGRSASNSDDETEIHDYDQNNRRVDGTSSAYSQYGSTGSSNTGRTNTAPFGSNIHTLRHDEDDSDIRRNNFWNGNSTQYGGDSDKR